MSNPLRVGEKLGANRRVVLVGDATVLLACKYGHRTSISVQYAHQLSTSTRQAGCPACVREKLGNHSLEQLHSLLSSLPS